MNLYRPRQRAGMVGVNGPFWCSPKLFRFITNANLSLLVKLAVVGLWTGPGIAKRKHTFNERFMRNL